MPKILLLTDVPPCSEFSGALLTKQLCRFLPEDIIECVTILSPGLNYIKKSNNLGLKSIKYYIKPRENRITGLKIGKLNGFATFLFELYNSFIGIKCLIRKILKFSKDRDITKIWCILQGQTMIRLAFGISKKMKIPLYIQIWDHPDWWLKENGIDRYTRKRLLKQYYYIIKKSKCCAVASYSMADDLKKIQHEVIPLIASLEKSVIKKPILKKGNSIVIGVVGQLYSKIEWKALLNALDSVNWFIKNKEVIIKYLGYTFVIEGRHKKSHIEYLGYRDQNETIQLMSECDILYCPYFFGREYEIIARTSFPSKLATYLAAGRPVFFHGPEYSSPAKFLIKYDAAQCCFSLDKTDIINSLIELYTNERLYKNISQNGYTAINKNLTTDTLRDNFYRFLGL